jgi:hypothetical protein
MRRNPIRGRGEDVCEEGPWEKAKEHLFYDSWLGEKIFWKNPLAGGIPKNGLFLPLSTESKRFQILENRSPPS